MRNKSSGQVIGSGYVKFEEFKKFLRKNPYIEAIETSLSGEIFLNPDFIKIIKYAHEKNVRLTALNGVNFNTVSDEILEALAEYKFTAITFSIDGASNETYSIYRRNGNFDKVINNINKLNEFKRKYNSKFPILVWQFIIFEHNKHEVEKAYELAKKLNFSNIYYKLPWKDTKYTNEEMNRLRAANSKRIPLYDGEILTVLQENNNPLCFQPWIQPQINWDGRLLGCCCSTNHDLGVNVFKSGIKSALGSNRMKKMRRILEGNFPAESGFACNYCGFYEKMKQNNHFINSKKFKF